MKSARLPRSLAAFLIGVSLAWAVLLLFHPMGTGTLYEGLRNAVARGRIVHLGTLVFIGLMGLGLYWLVRDLPGTAARVTRIAAGIFVLFYGAWETVAGLAVPAMVQYTTGLPASDRVIGSNAVDALSTDPIVGDLGLVSMIGSGAWIVAVIAAAFAVRHAGAPRSAAILLGLSVIVVQHPPPAGPLGLAFFAGAVVLIYRTQHVDQTKPAESGVPVPAPTA
jgi:hypothetical protein